MPLNFEIQSTFMKTNVKILLFLLIASVFDVMLVLFRNVYFLDHELAFYPVSTMVDKRGVTFLFLIWNLILAWIPYLLGKLFPFIEKLRKSAPAFLAVGLLWLLFFPNSLYIITDLFHLKVRHPIPLWYDLIMIFSFAWTGLMLGYAAIIDLQHLIQRKTGKNRYMLIIGLLIPLSSIGIFLGRYLRWNSWEVFSDPLRLLTELQHILLHPNMLLAAVLFCCLLSVLLLMIYLPFKIFQHETSNT